MARIVKKPEERRQEIVKAARHLFQTKEYDQATMKDVMESVGIAKGTIYHYFKSKKELLEAVIDDMVTESLDAMQRVVDGAEGNALQKIQSLTERGNIAAEEPAILDHLHQPGNEAMHVRLLAATLAKQAPLYAQLIQQGCDEGLFHTDCPLESAEFVLAAVQFLTDVGIYPWTEKELIRRARAFPKLIEQQLKAPPGSFDFMVQSSVHGTNKA
ncbi:MAG: TetR/AcrR family transcriptional regulator [Chlamydiales bacterium]|nr:TetR/AcrR family transcriptional regulator [Chlamydiia bacterium]MCP5506769.1 TetR/AcrR family transcriptional regulator [Chlamydiales bacterium]